jgi:hypothetical protein
LSFERKAMPFNRSAHANSGRRVATALGAAIAGIALIFAPDIAARAQGVQGSPKEVPITPDSAPGANLSEKLDRSKGVLRPPAGVDPEIQAPAPEPNPQTTPVIPPPGTPGGDQSVQPK